MSMLSQFLGLSGMIMGLGSAAGESYSNKGSSFKRNQPSKEKAKGKATKASRKKNRRK